MINEVIQRMENNKIYRLSFNSYSLYNYGVEYITDKIINLSSSLTHLSLNNVKLCNIGIHYLSIRLVYIPQLTFLSLSCIIMINYRYFLFHLLLLFFIIDNMIDDEGISELFNHLLYTTNLKRLYLEDNKISGISIQSISKELNNLTNLEVLDISHNQILDDSFIYLSKYISNCVNLKELIIYSIIYLFIYTFYRRIFK